jgi:methionyl-tRNA synthetase
MSEVLGTLYRCIIDLSIGLLPVAPGSASRLLDAMGVPPEDRSFASLEHGGPGNPDHVLEQPVPVFPRLELTEEAA